jgi:hypothetical protein
VTEAQKNNFQRAYANASYTLAEFKKDVTTQLAKKYGSAVKPGNKAIFIQAHANRRDADVLVAAVHRRYYSFSGMESQSHEDGIYFLTSSGTRIVNFPKQHSENCTAKHQKTSQWFKPMVRVLKNMRNRMVEDGLIKDGVAPSYFLEGLFYNVPDQKFGSSYGDTFAEAFNWIIAADRKKFLCANRLYYLLGNSNVTWPEASCEAYLSALRNYWNNWS